MAIKAKAFIFLFLFFSLFHNYSATQYVHICVVDALEMTFFALKGPLRLSIYTDRAVCDCGQFYSVSKGAIAGFYGLILVCFCTV